MSFTSEYANVVTTIQHPTRALKELAKVAASNGESLFIIGDRKSPNDFFLENATYYSPDVQESLNYKVTDTLPWNSYTRKMIGYLEAVRNGNKYIRETDDDNFPLNNFFCAFPHELDVRSPDDTGICINPYRYFSDEYIWPRGFPLELISGDRRNHELGNASSILKKVTQIGVVQGLANGAPDVDALLRLTQINHGDFEFNSEVPLYVPLGTFAPFNSQVTIWDCKFLPIMYLPQTCTFRMTDIWRSFIATRLLHINGYSLVFTSASAYQERNEHNLIKDFSDEVPGYVRNIELIRALESIELLGSLENIGKDLRSIYEELVLRGFFEKQELVSLDAFLGDCRNIMTNSAANHE